MQSLPVAAVPAADTAPHAVAGMVFCTEGQRHNVTSCYKRPHNMQVDTSQFDECSGELCRHTPDPKGMTSLLVLELKPAHNIINKYYSCLHQPTMLCHKMLFNACVMLPGNDRKEKVQVQLQKTGGKKIVMPADTHDDYCVVVCAKDMSHYVTRVGGVYKIMLHMHDCTICTAFKDPKNTQAQGVESLHKKLFGASTGTACLPAGPNFSTVQQIGSVKLTIGAVCAEKYCTKFLVTMVFMQTPPHIKAQYYAKMAALGMCERVLTEWGRVRAIGCLLECGEFPEAVPRVCVCGWQGCSRAKQARQSRARRRRSSAA